MAAVISIRVETSGGLDDVKKDVADLGKTAEKEGGGGFSAMSEIATGALRRVGEMVVNVGAAAFSKFAEVIGDSITAAKESNLIAAQTAAVIKSTGEAAGVTSDHVLDYASSLSAAAGTSLFGDEQIAQSTNLLLTFTEIKGATLDAATAISVDMAQAMGGAPKDAAIQLGKALNDPTKGITALSRVGVTFSKEQKATIEALQDTGDMAGAQAVILAELNKEFGGSAQAAAAADGGFAQFKDQLGEMEETIGKALLPVLGQLIGFIQTYLFPVIESASNVFASLISYFQSVVEDGDTMNDFLSGVPDVFQPVVKAIGDAVVVIQGLIETLTDLWSESAGSDFGDRVAYIIDQLLGFGSAIGPAQTAIRALMDAFSGTGTATSGLTTALTAVWTVLQTQVWPILTDLGTALFPLVGAAIQILAGFWTDVLVPALRNAWTILTTVILPVIASVAGWLKDNLPGAIQSAANFLTNTLFPALHGVFTFINTSVVPILQSVAKWLIENVPVAIQKTTDFFNTTLLPAMKSIWNFVKDNIIPIISDAVVWLRDNVPPAIQKTTDFFNTTLLPALNAIWNFVKDNIIPIIKTLVEVNIAALNRAITEVARIWKDVLLPAITAILTFITEKLAPLFKTFIEVNIAAWSSAFTALGKLWNETFIPAMHSVHDYIYNTLGPKLATLNDNVLVPMGRAWNYIYNAVDGLIGKISDFVDAMAKVDIPDWLQGQSPPPMADWFMYISESVKGVNAQLPMMAMNLSAQLGPSGQSVSNTASTRSFTYAPQISTTGNVSAPMDLALASSLAGV